MSLIEEKRRKEIAFWQEDENERPGVESIFNLVNKVQQVEIFLRAFKRVDFEGLLKPGVDVLEIGGGQGWASCVIKKLFPSVRIRSCDLADAAMKSQPFWERVFGVTLQDAQACPSDNLAYEDESMDIIFTFSAAHHFITHADTIAECLRVLKVGGKLIYFYEPVTPRFWYRIAKWRVNRKRPTVPEDLLILDDLRNYAESVGGSFKVTYHPDPKGRGRIETVYYSLQTLFPFLCRYLPTTATITIEK